MDAPFSYAEKWNVIQIIPAAGWFAEYKQKDNDKIHVPLVCWALVQSPDYETNFVVGLDADSRTVDFCNDMDNLVGYVHESNIE